MEEQTKKWVDFFNSFLFVFVLRMLYGTCECLCLCLRVNGMSVKTSIVSQRLWFYSLKNIFHVIIICT